MARSRQLTDWLVAANQGADHDFFVSILQDKRIITSYTCTVLLLMAFHSTMLTIRALAPKLQRVKEIVLRQA